MAQARRHHLRQQLTPEEQEEFDEQYGDEDDLLFEEEEDGLEHQIDEECEGDLQEGDEEELEDGQEEEAQAEEERQMDYYMQQHPDLLLALDIAAFRRQQIQQRLQASSTTGRAASNVAGANASAQQRSPRSLFPEDNEREDLEDDEAQEEAEEAFLRNQRLNIYGNLALTGPQGSGTQQYAHSASNSLGHDGAINLGLSMGVNIGTYGYQGGTGTLLQQLNYSNVRSDEGAAEDGASRAGGRAGDEEDQDDVQDLLQEGDEEDEEEEYDTQNEDDDAEGDEDDDADEEGDDIVDEEENDLECYLRNVNIDNSRIRARTAPLRPMEHIAQFKMTPNFTNLEQAAVCAVQIVQRND